MPYKVQFVGLVCFYRDGASRQALLPDGRNPGNDIAPHYPKLIVDPGAVESVAGWPSDEQTQRGIYALPDSIITIEGMDSAGTLDTSAHDGLLPQLREIDPNFEIDLDSAQTVARLHVRQGVLSARQVPGGTAIMSQLVVPHNGSIDAVVTPRDGSSALTLRLAAGTEILIGNMSEHGIYDEGVAIDRHFEIYAKLSSNPVSLQDPDPATVASVSPPETNHWLFTRASPINLSVSCSNTGCC